MNKKKLLKYFLFYVFTIISSLCAVILYIKYYPVESKVITESVNKTIVTETGIEGAIANVYDAVVTVQSYSNNILYGTGSGFVYKTDDKYGYILTNNHVIENSNGFQIVLQNGTSIDAKLLGSDSYTDLAVLSIEKKDVIKVATLGSSDLIEIGNSVFTVGSPMGSQYSGSVTRGVVSGKNRTVEADGIVTDVIQTDAAINPGNSGGPLVNLAGEVIGITSMKLANTSIEGMGFAIPIDTVKVYVKYLEKGEKISRPEVDASFLDVSDRYRLFYYGINVSRNISSGAVIIDIENNSEAAKAGLRVGDVITMIDDNKVDTVSKLRYYLYKYNIGDKVKVTFVRNNKEQTTEVVLSGN